MLFKLDEKDGRKGSKRTGCQGNKDQSFPEHLQNHLSNSSVPFNAQLALPLFVRMEYLLQLRLPYIYRKKPGIQCEATSCSHSGFKGKQYNHSRPAFILQAESEFFFLVLFPLLASFLVIKTSTVKTTKATRSKESVVLNHSSSFLFHCFALFHHPHTSICHQNCPQVTPSTPSTPCE